MPAKEAMESSDEAGPEGGDSDGEEYERRPRRAPQEEGKKRTDALPIKTPDGQVVYGDQAERGSGAPKALVSILCAEFLRLACSDIRVQPLQLGYYTTLQRFLQV